MSLLAAEHRDVRELNDYDAEYASNPTILDQAKIVSACTEARIV